MPSYTFSQIIDFTRTTSGTFVGSNGLIQTTPASVNLLTFTQEFDNAVWTKTNATVTANSTTAPDGTSTADAAIPTTTPAVNKFVQQTFTTYASGTTYTHSVYAKAFGYTGLQIVLPAAAFSGPPFANFDLANGIASVTYPYGGSGATATITNVGDGWYRCSVTMTATGTAATAAQLRIMNTYTTTDTTYTANGTSGIFIWGAQLEQASAATTYTRNFGGLFPPRFDYDPVTLAPKGILIEEQRTNLLLRSEQFDNASWNKVGATVTADATTSPDGTVDADALVEDGTTGTHYTQQFYTGFTSGTAYTMSAFIKAGTRTWVEMDLPSAAFGVAQGGYFNLSGSGSLGNATGSPTSRTITALGNGWYRITVTATATATAGGNCLIIAASANGTTSYAGTNGAQALFLYGAQLEAGAFATSYIPTVASTVTRTADQAVIQAPMFAPWFNGTTGTFCIEFDRFTYGVNSVYYGLSATDGASTNLVGFMNFGTGVIERAFSGGVDTVTLSGGNPAANAVVKGAAIYGTADYAISVNGAAAVTQSTGAAPVSLNRLNIGNLNSANFLNGHIRSVRYYPLRLTNAQLQALTV